MFVQILETFATQVASFCASMLGVKVILVSVGSNIVENAHIVETGPNC